MRRILVLVPERVELFDLAGPVQVFHEANAAGAQYEVQYVATQAEIVSEQSLAFSALRALPSDLGVTDTVIVPGSVTLREDVCERRARVRPIAQWIRDAYDAGARVASVCVGAFALGAAGLLDGRTVTTHWKYVDLLQRSFPKARVADNRLYVFDGRIATSAGIASGVDLALAMTERDAGPRIAAIAAREMVVGVRRAGSQEQLSAYFDRRDHVAAEVHAAQDWLVEHVGETFTLESLAKVAGVSARTLTRQFRAATGTTVKAYATSLRMEHAAALLGDPHLTVDAVAEQCGFADARQFRRLWRARFGSTPSGARKGSGHEPVPG